MSISELLREKIKGGLKISELHCLLQDLCQSSINASSRLSLCVSFVDLNSDVTFPLCFSKHISRPL